MLISVNTVMAEKSAQLERFSKQRFSLCVDALALVRRPIEVYILSDSQITKNGAKLDNYLSLGLLYVLQETF